MNVSDARVVKKKEDEERRLLKKKEENFYSLMSTKEGRSFVWDLLGECGLYKESAHQSGSWTYYNEGKRSIALGLIKRMVKVAPDAYVLMMNENKGEN